MTYYLFSNYRRGAYSTAVLISGYKSGAYSGNGAYCDSGANGNAVIYGNENLATDYMVLLGMKCTWVNFCVPLASQNPYPIIVYSVANSRPHLKDKQVQV